MIVSAFGDSIFYILQYGKSCGPRRGYHSKSKPPRGLPRLTLSNGFNFQFRSDVIIFLETQFQAAGCICIRDRRLVQDVDPMSEERNIAKNRLEW